jgi:hypothetical protein
MSRIYLLLIATSILLLICTSLLSTSGLSTSTNSGLSSQQKLQYPLGGESYIYIELPWTGKQAVSMLSAANNTSQDHGSVENDESSSQYNLSGQWKVNLTTDAGTVLGDVNIRQNNSEVYVYASNPNNARCGNSSTDPSIWGTLQDNNIRGHAHECTINRNLDSHLSTQVVDELPASVDVLENGNKMRMNLTIGNGHYLSITFTR